MIRAARSARLRRKPSRALGLDILEERVQLSTTAFVDDGILHIQGDRRDNALVLTVDGQAETATLTSGGQDVDIRGLDEDSLNFRAIDIEGGRGNDAITLNLSNLTSTSARPLTITVEGGPGNDTIVLNANDLSVPQGTALDLDVEGGPGNDAVTLNMNGATIDGRFDADIELGRGNDTLDLVATSVAVGSTGLVDLDVEGGPGDDQAALDLSGLAVDSGGDVRIRGEGGPGNDTVTGDDSTIEGVDLDFDEWDGQVNTSPSQGKGPKSNKGGGKSRGFGVVATTPAAQNANPNAAFNRGDDGSKSKSKKK